MDYSIRHELFHGSYYRKVSKMGKTENTDAHGRPLPGGTKTEQGQTANEGATTGTTKNTGVGAKHW